MKIIENLIKVKNENGLKYEYSYKLVKNNLKNKDIFGIEVERLDFEEDKLVNLERDFIKYISIDELKVKELLLLLAENIVSPIHLVNILGEYVDIYTEEMNEERAVAYS